MAPGLALGRGTLLVVAHDLSDPHAAGHRHDQPELVFDAAEVTAAVPAPEWTVITNAVKEWPRAGTGQMARDLVIRAQRVLRT